MSEPSAVLRAVRKLRASQRKGITHWSLDLSSTSGRAGWGCMAMRLGGARPVWHYNRDPVKAAEAAIKHALGEQKPPPRSNLDAFPGRG